MPLETNDAAVPVIVRSRITRINSEKYADIPVSGLEINVQFDTVSANNQYLEIRFTYIVNYKEKVGRLEMGGVLLFEMDPGKASQIASKWNTEHRFDDDVASAVLNNIHYKCGTEAVLPTKVLELPAPILPPRIGVSREKPDLSGMGKPN